jgi:diguanylate cyclase (GGDEF)-like protein/PAS domain S-box-containing protein
VVAATSLLTLSAFAVSLLLTRSITGIDLLRSVLTILLMSGMLLIIRTYLRHLRATHNAQYKAVVDNALDIVVVAHPETRRLLYVNPAFERHFNVGLSDALLKTTDDVFVLSEPIDRFNRRFESALYVETKMRAGEGRDSGIDVQVNFCTSPMDGAEVWVYTARDVTQRRTAEQQLLSNQTRLDHMAHHDQLTGLPNRHYMTATLPNMLVAAKNSGSLMALIFLDLDRFKFVNDTLGHEVGDRLLQAVAARLRASIRSEDILFRMGGDEFVVVLNKVTSEDEATRGANRIGTALREPVVIDGGRLQISASIGISLFPRDGVDMHELLKHSDTAMYSAKDRGRDNVQMFTSVMDKALKRRVAVEAMLREAISGRQFDVYYQPILNLASQEIVGLEALIRWQHPTKGMIPPDWFITVAEETGLIVPIGNFVLRRVLENMAEWRHAGATLVPVSLNVAPAQLVRGDFRTMILHLLRTNQIDAKLLQLEMTERTIFDIASSPAGNQGRDSIGGLRDLGIQIAIDDFGTGYSSLSRLHQCPLDFLKIDRSFVSGMNEKKEADVIVACVLALSKGLGIETIAEGIEDEEQLERLSDAGCELAQGLLWSPAVPLDEANRLASAVGPIPFAKLARTAVVSK